MKRIVIALLCAGLTGVATSDTTLATGDRLLSWKPRLEHRRTPRDKSFERVGTFANYRNNANVADETVAEIVAATADGRTLVYTDGVKGEIGFIDITNPANPLPGGKFAFPSGHEPTSVDVLGNKYALVAVNSSASFKNTSGYVAVVDLATRTTIREIDLGGQPDSLTISPDSRYAAVAIENERDETLCVGGTQNGLAIVGAAAYVPGVNTTAALCASGAGVAGGLPQTPLGNPAGYLVVMNLSLPSPFGWTRSDVALAGLAPVAGDDPEPEFVDINSRNHAVVTLQENNHIVIVDLATRSVINHFPAGAVNLTGVDATEDGVIKLTDSLSGVPREPDSVAWVPGPFGRVDIATANEGDLAGGSRGFTLFRRDGAVTFDSGATFEEIAVRHGHYPEDRSENKGTEPEAIEYARFGGSDYLFVGSERGSFVAVYELDRLGRPRFSQLLPAPFGPEGLLAIPHRNLLIASGEEDVPSFGVRSTVMIYQLKPGEPSYPQIVSDITEDTPLGWSALSGMTSVPGEGNTLLAVWDSYYSQSRIFRIDVSEKPAVIVDAVTITGGRGGYDPEGIAIAPDRTLWIASEGNASDSVPNLLIQTNGDGQVLAEVGLPAEILACRQTSTKRGTLGSGFEGVAAVPTGEGRYRLFVAQQRGWDYTTAACEDLDDDAGGLNVSGEPNRSRIWIYDPQTKQWTFVAWELAPKPVNATWVGLSEISTTPWGEFILIERDNRTGDFGVLKTLVKINAAAGNDGVISTSEKSVFDFRPRLTATNGWITDKPEGVAVTHTGRTFVVTDNDGVEDWSGESWFLSLGPYWRLF